MNSIALSFLIHQMAIWFFDTHEMKVVDSAAGLEQTITVKGFPQKFYDDAYFGDMLGTFSYMLTKLLRELNIPRYNISVDHPADRKFSDIVITIYG